jgi:hypothetical protein
MSKRAVREAFEAGYKAGRRDAADAIDIMPVKFDISVSDLREQAYIYARGTA